MKTAEHKLAKEVNRQIAKILSERRKELGMSQIDIEKLTGIDQGNLSHFEAGQCCLSIGRLMKYAEAVKYELRFTLEAV